MEDIKLGPGQGGEEVLGEEREGVQAGGPGRREEPVRERLVRCWRREHDREGERRESEMARLWREASPGRLRLSQRVALQREEASPNVLHDQY